MSKAKEFLNSIEEGRAVNDFMDAVADYASDLEGDGDLAQEAGGMIMLAIADGLNKSSLPQEYVNGIMSGMKSSKAMKKAK